MVIETCGHLESAELIQLCTFLDANISSLKLTPWITAAFGLLTGLVISWIIVIGNRHAQSRERHNNAQRKALLDMQDLALKLRNRWHEHLGYIQEHPNAGAPFSAHEQTALQGEFQTAVTRLDNFYLRKVYLDWEDYAQNLFNGADDHQDFIEEKLWTTTLDRSGANIRWMDG